MKLKTLFILCLGAFLFTSVPAFAKDAKFVGAKGCKKCHKKKKSGEQFKIWSKSKHAKAYSLLASKKAIKKAKEMGIKTHPQKAKECLICHTAGTGLSKKHFEKKFSQKDGVQCENCHGAGSLYKKKKTMKKLRKLRLAGKEKEYNKLAKKVGFNYGDEKTCTSQCHQKERTVDGGTYINPSYQPFDFKERIKEIAHPVPMK